MVPVLGEEGRHKLVVLGPHRLHHLLLPAREVLDHRAHEGAAQLEALKLLHAVLGPQVPERGGEEGELSE